MITLRGCWSRCKGIIERLTKQNRSAYPVVARWVGLAGIVYGALDGNPAIIYGFLGLLAAPWITGGGKNDGGSS